jgi:hypothetical protein
MGGIHGHRGGIHGHRGREFMDTWWGFTNPEGGVLGRMVGIHGHRGGFTDTEGEDSRTHGGDFGHRREQVGVRAYFILIIIIIIIIMIGAYIHVGAQPRHVQHLPYRRALVDVPRQRAVHQINNAVIVAILRERGEGALHDLIHQAEEGVGGEGVLEGAHLVEHATEGPHVGLVGVGLVRAHLRGHVVGLRGCQICCRGGQWVCFG